MMQTMLGMSLGAVLMALLLFLLKPLLKKHLSPAICYGLWLLVLLRLCLPLPGFLPVPAEETEKPAYVTPAPVSVPVRVPAAAYELPPTPQPRPAAETVPAASIPAEKTEEARPQLYLRLPDLAEVALWLWLLGAAALLGCHVVCYARFASLIRKSAEAAADWERELLHELHPKGNIALCRCSAVPVPMLLGFLRPTIVLGGDSLTEEDLRGVLLHELTHYRRGDLAVKWFATLILSLHWFNPFCPLIRRELDHACELSCDEAVIAAMTPQQRQSYGETLIRLSAERSIPRPVPATALSEGKEHLKERLTGIMNYRKRDPLTVLLGLVCAALLVGCGAAVGGAEQTPHTPAPTHFATDGNIWASDGNIWASSGDAAVAPYATMGDAQLSGDMDWAPHYTTPGNAQGGEEVTVSTVDEFLDALAPYTTVVLEPGVYDLGAVEPTARQYAYWKPTWDGGMELVLTNLENTRIVSATGDPADVSIITPHATANVLRMEWCYSTHMEGITLGHSEEAGICSGGVLGFENSYSLYVDDCDFYGCGSIGIQMNGAGGLTVTDSIIHDCSASGLHALQSNTILLENTDFVNCGEFDILTFWNCSSANIENCSFRDNESTGLFSVSETSGLVIRNCELTDNYFSEGLINSFYSGVEFFDTELDESQYANFYHPYSTVTPVYIDGEEYKP